MVPVIDAELVFVHTQVRGQAEPHLELRGCQYCIWFKEFSGPLWGLEPTYAALESKMSLNTACRGSQILSVLGYTKQECVSLSTHPPATVVLSLTRDTPALKH